jgi:oligosaccharide repeat unit polymerase
MTRLYLHPIFVFTIMWAVVISSYWIAPSHFYLTSTAAHFILLQFFVVSAITFYCAYWVGAVCLKRFPRRDGLDKACSKVLLKRAWIMCALFGVIVFVLIMNLWRFGLPPLINHCLHLWTPYVYMYYGHLKNVLYCACYILVMLSFGSAFRSLRFAIWALVLGVFILYLSRGPIIFIVLQVLTYYLLTRRSAINVGKLLGIFLGFVILLLLIMSVLGMVRTGNHVFMESMQIKSQFQTWPTSLLWVVTYFSAPMVNAVSFVMRAHQYDYHGLLSLSIMMPPAIAEHILPLSKQIFLSYLVDRNNNAFSYLGAGFLDFGWWGVVLVNIIYGVCGGVFYQLIRWKRYHVNNWIYAIYVTQLIFIGFYPLLMAFPALCEFALVWLLALAFPGIFSSFAQGDGAAPGS